MLTDGRTTEKHYAFALIAGCGGIKLLIGPIGPDLFKLGYSIMQEKSGFLSWQY